MPSPQSPAQYLRSQREVQTRADQKVESSKKLGLFVGLTAQASIGTAGIGLIFWQSWQEWGALPSTSGSGGFLYFLDAIAVALLWLGAFYGWYQWRQPY